MSILDDGLAVFSGVGLDSSVLNRLFTTKVGSALGKSGMAFAASGGHIRKGVLVWNGGGSKLVFQMNPESIKRTRAPVYAETMVPGQNSPMYTFINGGAREVTFQLRFHYAERRRDHVLRDIQTLESLTERPASGLVTGAYQGPPVVYLFFGDMFPGTPFIVASVSTTTKMQFDPSLLLPMYAEVDLTLWQVHPTQADKVDSLDITEQIGSIRDIVGRL